MQPWNFIVVADHQTRIRVQDLFERERLASAQFFDEPRPSQYLSYKLAGILESPLNLCVTCDPTSAGPAVIGRNSAPETDLYSTCCAIENLWLAARAEGLGVGWVSILKAPQLRTILASRRTSSQSPISVSAILTHSLTGPSWRRPAGCRGDRWPGQSTTKAGGRRPTRPGRRWIG